MSLPAFIPKDTKWFIADLVIAIHVGRRRRVTVHINTVLVRASRPREALRKAVELGRREEMSYENSAGERVRFSFLGLRNLDVVHDAIEHGCELRFHEALGKSMRQARALVSPREKLSVFQPREPSKAPDYASGTMMPALEEAMQAPPRSRTSQGTKAARRANA